MKSKAIHLITILLVISFSQNSFAQTTGVEDLVEQFRALLHPSTEQSPNSLSYTQQFLDLKTKLAGLGEGGKTLFQESITQFEKDPGYEQLRNMLFPPAGAQSQGDSIQIVKPGGTAPQDVKPVVVLDSTFQMQVFDKRKKLTQTVQLKPGELESRMKKDGYQIAGSSYDVKTKVATLNLAKSDDSGITAKVTINTTGDYDVKYKFQQGQLITIHTTADGTSVMKVTDNKAVKKTK